MRIIIIGAMDESRGIGYRGRIPWRCPADLKHFKASTLGKVVVVGSTTFAETGALAGREWWVLSRKQTEIAGATVFASVDAVIAGARSRGLREIVVAGGSNVYAQFLEHADTVLLSVIPGVHAVDSYFPEFEGEGWELEREEDREGFKLLGYERSCACACSHALSAAASASSSCCK